MDPDDQRDDPQYISQLHFGVFAAVLAPWILWEVLSYALFGTWYPTASDQAWAIYSQSALTPHDEPLDDSTVVSLTRTMCFGECPEYSVRIFGSGRVEYLGSHYVCAFGKHEAMTDPREVRRLVEAMIASGFFGYSWQHSTYVTDSSTATSALRHHGRSSAIWHYHGDTAAPPWVGSMENEIDRVAGTARWLPVQTRTKDHGWQLLCPSPEGGVREVTLRSPIEDKVHLIIHPVIEPPRIKLLLPLPYDEPIVN